MIYGQIMPTPKQPVNLYRFNSLLTTGNIGRLGKTSDEVADDIASWLVPITSFETEFLLSDGPIRGNKNTKKKYNTVLEHDPEVQTLLGLPHFAKYAMHSFQIKLYLEAEFGKEDADFMGLESPEIEWIISDDVINPSDTCYRAFQFDDYMFSVYQTGKKGIEKGFGPAILDNWRDQTLTLLGPTMLKVRNEFVSAIAKRFNSQVVKQGKVPISERMIAERMMGW